MMSDSQKINSNILLSKCLQLNSTSPQREEMARSGLDEGRQFLASRDGKKKVTHFRFSDHYCLDFWISS